MVLFLIVYCYHLVWLAVVVVLMRNFPPLMEEVLKQEVNGWISCRIINLTTFQNVKTSCFCMKTSKKNQKQQQKKPLPKSSCSLLPTEFLRSDRAAPRLNKLVILIGIWMVYRYVVFYTNRSTGKHYMCCIFYTGRWLLKLSEWSF